MMKYVPVVLVPTSPAKMVSSEEDVVSGVASEKLQKGQSLDIKLEATESNEDVSALSIIPHKMPQVLATADAALQSDNRHNSSVKPEKVSETSASSALTLLPIEEVRTPLMTPEKASQKPDSSVYTLHSVQEGRNPSVLREKRPDDGYNWRKYGQKNVKGNEYIRSYYKCTYSNCQVKRQVERSLDGQITDTIYFGEHDHPKPQANLPQSVGFVVSTVENKPAAASATIANDTCNMHCKTPNHIAHPTVAESDDVKSELQQLANRRRDEGDYNDAPNSKRQKKDNLNANLVGKSGGDQRLVVKTMSEVDAVSDGYRWRKYGQKLVKGNPNPRNYYRCSSPSCPVKKHVERASHDPKMFVATYEGQHDHDMPPCRTVTYTIAEQNNQTIAQDGELGTKSRENKEVCLDMVVHKSTDLCGTPPPPPGRIISNDKVGENTKMTAQAGESGPKRKENDTICLDMGIHTSSSAVKKSDEQLNGESGTKSEVCDTVSSSIAVHSGLDAGSESNKPRNVISGDKSEENDIVGPEVRATGPLNGQLRTQSEGGNVCESPSSISKEQQSQTPKAEAAHS